MTLQRRLIWIGLGLGMLSALAEAGGLAGRFQARQARTALEARQPREALQWAEQALRLDPWLAAAEYSRAVALKRLGQWDDLIVASARAERWHPDGYSLMMLRGEAQMVSGKTAAAAETFWRGFWQTPHPQFSAAQFWRMTMLAGSATWDGKDARTATAAVQALTLAPHDRYLPETDRTLIKDEAIGVLRSAGAGKTAEILEIDHFE